VPQFAVGVGVFVFATGLWIDAQVLAEDRLDVLAVVVWIATATAVSQADVELPVGSNGDRAALVILHLWLLHHEHHTAALGIGDVGIGGDTILGDHAIALAARLAIAVVDVEATVFRIV